MQTIIIDGNTLDFNQLYKLGYHSGNVKIEISEESWVNVRKARAVIEKILEKGEVAYGITTGFGKFANVVIPQEHGEELQYNLIRSHASGIGEPLSIERTRMLLALRINVLAKGYSGIREETLRKLVYAYNHDCLSKVPCKGTVGASGDLAPLAHLALGLLGEGEMWDFEQKKYVPAMEVLQRKQLEPITLTFKEGLALINGTQLITALAAEALYRSVSLTRTADVISAITLDTLRGTPKAFTEEVHKARPHNGQMLVAERLRKLLHNEKYKSEIYLSHEVCDRLQDSYTLRCIPQVHGIVIDTIEFVKNIINTEINSATDNPMVLFNSEKVISAGNFHGEYPAKACDYLTIAIQEIANISERRIERLMNPDLSGLPAFLVKSGGLNSGFMIAHCTAAALTSENKTLCHPGSSDTISTSSAKEDHVSMGGWCARKCLDVVQNVEIVVAIEMLCACQALDFLRDLHTTEPLEAVYNLVRTRVKSYDRDRYMNPDIEAAVDIVRSGLVWETVEPYISE